MAAVFEIDDHRSGDRGPAALVDLGLETIEAAIGELSPKRAVAELARAQRRLAGLETDLLAAHVTADGDSSAAEKLAGDGKRSRRETRRRSRRAAANAASGGKLGAKLVAGELSEEQADLIADASAKTDGAAAADDDLIDQIADIDPDQGKGVVDDWVARQRSKDDVQTEHDRQRALRRTQTYLSKKHGLGVISIEGDSVSQRRMIEAIKARADEIYRRDGGRDLPAADHPRTRAQREFDAALELLCGIHTSPNGTTTPIDDGPAGGSASPARRASRPAIVIGLTLDTLISADAAVNAANATQIGLGLIPDSVLADYAQYADLFAALYDRNGEPLWLGRLRRHGSDAQYIALAIRDRGCVCCGAPISECQMHHLTPYHAPAKGRTDLNDMALLARHCHHELHQQQQTLYRDDQTGRWKRRPATAAETPPPRPHRPGRDTPPQRQ